MNEHFVKVPHDLLRDPKLSAIDVAVYCQLARDLGWGKDADDSVFPRRATIMRRLGRSGDPGRITRASNRLEDSGWLTKTRMKALHSRTYYNMTRPAGNHFVLLPVKVLDAMESRLSPALLRDLLRWVLLAGGKGVTHDSIRTFCIRFPGQTARTVSAHRQELVELGLLSISTNVGRAFEVRVPWVFTPEESDSVPLKNLTGSTEFPSTESPMNNHYPHPPPPAADLASARATKHGGGDGAEVKRVASAVTALRPGWYQLERILFSELARGYDITTIERVALACANDPNVRAPGAIKKRLQWESDEPPAKQSRSGPPTFAESCRDHPGHWAGPNCSGCRADRLAIDPTASDHKTKKETDYAK